MRDVVSVTLLTEVFVTLFVIMDPVGTIPIFLSLTRGRSRASARRAAWQAVIVSFGVIVAFALVGQQILDYLDNGLLLYEKVGKSGIAPLLEIFDYARAKYG